MKKIFLLLVLLISCTHQVIEVNDPVNKPAELNVTDFVIETPEKNEIKETIEKPEYWLLQPNITEKTGKVIRKYNWGDGTINVTLFQSVYEAYKKTPREIRGYVLPENSTELIIKNVLNLNSAEGFEEIYTYFDPITKNDDFAELVTDFVQNISYDYEKLEAPDFTIKYPYETLYDQKGVCSDKTLLAAKILDHYGYGVALFLFEKEEHMSLGIQCPKTSSSYLSGYCYLETTGAEEIGVAPEILGDERLASQPQVLAISKGREYGRAEENMKEEVERREHCRKVEPAIAVFQDKEKEVEDLLERYKKTKNKIDYADYREAYTEYRRLHVKAKEEYWACRGKTYESMSLY